MNRLELLAATAADYQKLQPSDCAVLICDSSGVFVKCVPAKTFDMKVAEGDKISAGGAMSESLQSGKEVSRVLARELYGVVCKSNSAPIYENNQLLGAVAVVTSMAAQQALHETAQMIAATSQEMTATSEELAASAAKLAEELDKMRARGENVLEELKKTDEILRFVADVATNSNLLGLNAAIEAARAGELGRGFAVVAEEIRKMADSCSNAVKDIKSILGSIQTDTSLMVQQVVDTAYLGERQAAATEEISATMQQLASSANDIERIAEVV